MKQPSDWDDAQKEVNKINKKCDNFWDSEKDKWNAYYFHKKKGDRKPLKSYAIRHANVTQIIASRKTNIFFSVFDCLVDLSYVRKNFKVQ